MRKFILLIILMISLVVYLYRETIFEPSYLHQITVNDDQKFLFEDLEGPNNISKVAEATPTSWRKYNTNNLSAFAILLTDTASDWQGLVHGFKSIGIPFTITNDVQQAVMHHTVMVYPIVSGRVLNREELRTLAAIPRNGGNLIGINVYGGLNEVFDFDTVIANNSRSQLVMINDVPGVTDSMTHRHERYVRLTNQVDFPDKFPTNGYINAKYPIISYQEDGSTFLAYKDYGVGKAFAFGIDLGNYFLRYMNERGFNSYRSYANNFDGGIDVMLRILKKLYEQSPVGVTINTVPYNKKVNIVITHDIDYSKSIVNAVKYGQMEKQLGVKATYFIQTKYIRDWNDDIFFNKSTIKYVQQLDDMGMEIGSHSVSHSRVFSKFELGSGKEKYPRYSPFVQDKTHTYNGSILGELRISKFLLENFISKADVVSFRPGHLQNPFALSQAMEATGYLYSSCATANNVQTHLPFIRMYNRGYSSECSIVEIPITIEDELGAPMLQRLDSAIDVAKEISKYGGVMNILIHTDTLGQKIEFERQLINAIKDNAWIVTLRELGLWWKSRDKVDVIVKELSINKYELTVKNTSNNTVNGLTLNLPLNWQLLDSNENCIQSGQSLIIKHLDKNVKFSFSKR